MTIQTAAFSDGIGRGLEIGEHWGKGIEVERRIRLYHGRPAVVIWGRIANRTGRDVTLGTARLVDVSEADHGGWQLGESARPPAVVGYPDASPPCRRRPRANRRTPSNSTAVRACWPSPSGSRPPQWCWASCRPKRGRHPSAASSSEAEGARP